MRNKEFLEFLSGVYKPSDKLKACTQLDVSLSFKKNLILSKFLVFEALGAIISLSICPQFGLSMIKGHGLAHYFMAFGDFACAVFCASLFLTSGVLMTFLGMKGEELWWIWRRFKLLLVFLPAMGWGTLMLFNVSLNLDSESVLYNVSWILSAVFIQALWLEIRSKSFYRLRFS